MRLFTTLLASFLLFTAVLSGQAGMTVEINTPCTGPLTLTYTGTDATGRHMYGDESFNGPMNPVLSIFWDQASGSWFIGLFGTGSASDILYTTGPNAFSPNPPDSATEPYSGTAASGCNFPGTVTVSGTGTQSTAGIPCEGIGDDDMDGVCNDMDVCPGEDDTIDDDGDNIPDCNDPNPGVFDGVSFDSPCLGGVIAFTLSGNDGTRNTYANTAQGLEIVFDATNNRWEMRGSGAGGAVVYFNTLATIPDPPSTIAMAWEGDPAGGCADVPTVSGTGTQDSRCLNVVADCPDDGDACTEAALDDDCNCINVPITNVPPTAACNPTITVELDMDGVATLANADVDNGSADDACGSGVTLSLDRTDFDCDDIALGPITVTLTVTDDESAMATCTSAITVEDNIAPTFTCTNINVDLNAAGEYFISDSDVFTRMIQDWDDNCAPGPVNFGSGTRLITCANSAGGTFSFFFGARDGNGQEMTCSATVTVNDPLGACPGDVTANCTDFEDFTEADGTYTLDANSFDDGSTADLGLYSLAFSDATATVGQTADFAGNFNSTGHGQSFIAPQTGAIQKIKVRFVAAKSNATLFLYNSATGSGVVGSSGTPAYTQTGIELFASTAGADGPLTEITLTTPFPVVAGQSYSFVFDGFTHPYYSNDAAAYPDGDFIFGYDLASGCCTFGDLVFEVDFIGPTTMDYAAATTETIDVFAVDNQGNVSTACTSTFTLNDLCSFSQLDGGTFILSGDPQYCPNQPRTVGINATLAPGATLSWYRGTFANQLALVSTGTGTSATYTVPPSTSSVDYVVIIEGPAGCPTTQFVEYAELPETTPPTVATINITRMLNQNGMVSITANEVFDAANSSDNCDIPGFVASTDVTAVSVTPSMFTAADIGDNTVTVTGRDLNGNLGTQTAIVTIAAALPVEWLSFSANAGAKTVDLQWETTSEPDNAGFHIERSPDGNAWTVIAEQAPLESNLYLLVDEAPLTGENYYRVRQTDFDGTVTFSPVEVVYFIGDLTKVSVSPNPMTDEFTVIVPEAFGENVDLRLYDFNGRLIQLRMSATGTGTRVETRNLARGVYLLRATSQDGKQTQTVRVVRQ